MYKIYNEDCLIGLKKLENESIDMVLASPSFVEGYMDDKNT